MAIKDTIEVINRMRADGVIGKYAIGGAVGAMLYLEPAATMDVDIFVELPVSSGSSLVSLSPIYEYLIKKGFTTKAEYIVIVDWPVQFLSASNDLEREALEEARVVDVEGVSTRVMRAEHLVAIALKTGRTKDHARVLQFIEQDVLDKPRLDVVLTKYGLEAKFQEISRRLQ